MARYRDFRVTQRLLTGKWQAKLLHVVLVAPTWETIVEAVDRWWTLNSYAERVITIEPGETLEVTVGAGGGAGGGRTVTLPGEWPPEPLPGEWPPEPGSTWRHADRGQSGYMVMGVVEIKDDVSGAWVEGVAYRPLDPTLAVPPTYVTTRARWQERFRAV